MGTIDGFSIVGDLFPDGWAAVCGLLGDARLFKENHRNCQGGEIRPDQNHV